MTGIFPIEFHHSFENARVGFTNQCRVHKPMSSIWVQVHHWQIHMNPIHLSRTRFIHNKNGLFHVNGFSKRRLRVLLGICCGSSWVLLAHKHIPYPPFPTLTLQLTHHNSFHFLHDSTSSIQKQPQTTNTTRKSIF